jgi:hypothetical protein
MVNYDKKEHLELDGLPLKNLYERKNLSDPQHIVATERGSFNFSNIQFRPTDDQSNQLAKCATANAQENNFCFNHGHHILDNLSFWTIRILIHKP